MARDAPHPGRLPRAPRRRGAPHRGDAGACGCRGSPGGRRRRHRRRPRAWPREEFAGGEGLGAQAAARSSSGPRPRWAPPGSSTSATPTAGWAPSSTPTRRAGCASCARRSRRPPSGSPTSCARRMPTCCSATTPTAATGTATTCAVHEVGARAAELAGTPRVLQATVPRDTIARAVDLAARVYRFPPEFDRDGVRARLQRPRPRSPTASTCAGMPPRSGPRCAPTRRRPAPTTAPTGRWRPSCASPGRCTTWSSGASGTSTRAGPPGLPVAHDVFEGLA